MFASWFRRLFKHLISLFLRFLSLIRVSRLALSKLFRLSLPRLPQLVCLLKHDFAFRGVMHVNLMKCTPLLFHLALLWWTASFRGLIWGNLFGPSQFALLWRCTGTLPQFLFRSLSVLKKILSDFQVPTELNKFLKHVFRYLKALEKQLLLPTKWNRHLNNVQ